MNKRVSVIINTYNRGDHLKRLLNMLSKQTYSEFEVIVVNGPSTDNTKEVLEKYEDTVRVVECPVVNLSVSRNIGIRTSSGDILAFIDDDAIPANENWISNAVSYFDDNTIGAVGGMVLRMNKMVEFSNGNVNVWGSASCVNPSSKPGFDGITTNYASGGNAFYSRRILEKIGGFDEYYEYYLDEGDVAIRIAKAGYRIVHDNSVNIYHEAAGGHFRKTPYHLNWYVITKNQVYFAIKNTEGMDISEEERKKKAVAGVKGRLSEFKNYLQGKHITKEDYEEFVDMWNKGVETGTKDGFYAEKILDFGMKKDPELFRTFNKNFDTEILNIALICEADVIHPIGGVPVYTKALAKYLIKQGHNIHVISQGAQETFGMIEGINVHTVAPSDTGIEMLKHVSNARRVLEFSYAVAKKIRQCSSMFFIDIIETPIWDSAGVASTKLLNIPVCTRLETPLKMVIKTFNWEKNDDLRLLEDLELEQMKNSAGIIYISDCIKDTIEDLYDFKIPEMSTKNYLGIDKTGMAVRKRPLDDGKVEIFFVGRLERRKGMQNLMEVMPELLERFPMLEFNLAGNNEIVDSVIGCTFKEKFLKENKGKKWLDRVHFLGMISDEEREQNFADCDIFVSPSLYESFGIIFIEAMRYSKPVLGCDCGGMREVIQDGVTGLLSKPDDSASLKEKLVQLIENVELREIMGRKGLDRVNAMFNCERMAQETSDFYKRVLKKEDFIS